MLVKLIMLSGAVVRGRLLDEFTLESTGKVYHVANPNGVQGPGSKKEEYYPAALVERVEKV